MNWWVRRRSAVWGTEVSGERIRSIKKTSAPLLSRVSCPSVAALRRLSTHREGRRQRRELQSEVAAIVASMPIPAPFDLDRLVANVEEARGRRIVFVPLPDALVADTGLCGLWVKHASEPIDLILHAQSASAFHLQRIKLHELVHLWHDDADGLTAEEMAELLHAGLSSALVERLIASGKIAARRRYESHRELRTESAAALIHEQGLRGDFISNVTARRLAEDLSFSLGGPSTSRGADHV
ncbi:hypothetical protein [[Kitasatospora] papulosa]|uniref:hypothetical protein n=1 Tax=[Kitasatospora] papulosa TaxID=1464011 RepID=UPI0036A5128C